MQNNQVSALKCPNCGANVNSKFRFCEYCGAEIAVPRPNQVNTTINNYYVSPSGNEQSEPRALGYEEEERRYKNQVKIQAAYAANLKIYRRLRKWAIVVTVFAVAAISDIPKDREMGPAIFLTAASSILWFLALRIKKNLQ